MAPATDAPRRRPLLAALVGAALLAVLAHAAGTAGATAAVERARAGALLAQGDAASAATLARPSDGTVRRALAARPLDPRLVNVAMARALRGTAPAPAPGRVPTLPAGAGPWLDQLARLGWRDTVALENRLYAAAIRRDVAAVLDLCDALLRRRQIGDQVIPVLSTVELDPALRDAFARRLAARPVWRNTFLTATGHLVTPEQLAARARLLRVLTASGGLTEPEALANIRLLDARGEPGLSFDLWARTQPGVTRPLDDTGFRRAARRFAKGQDEDAVSWAWRVPAGEGFSAGPVEEGGRAAMEIDWDGRGVPVFAEQRTSATPGRYRLDVDVAANERPSLAALGFRLICTGGKGGAGSVAFRAIGGDPAHLLTDGAVPCAYPALQLGGEVQPSASPHRVAIRGLALTRVGA
jgi:hypothetical protein